MSVKVESCSGHVFQACSRVRDTHSNRNNKCYLVFIDLSHERKSMSVEKEDPIKLHKEGNTLYEIGKYNEAIEKFLQASALYERKNNFFDASSMLFKAAECSYMAKDYTTAIKRFSESSAIAFDKGFDRFGASALEYILDCYKATKKGKSKEAAELQQKIKKVKEQLASQSF